jgi:hypothetical protein
MERTDSNPFRPEKVTNGTDYHLWGPTIQIPADNRRLVIDDLINRGDHSWYVQPIGFLATVLLFPSFLMTGLFTTVQENYLLDLKAALERQPEKWEHPLILKRIESLHLIGIRTKHLDRALDYADKRATQEYFKLPQCGFRENQTMEQPTVNELRVVSYMYYKRYLCAAIERELYVRNPVKYDADFPMTGYISKFVVASFSSFLALERLVKVKNVPALTDEAKDILKVLKSRIDGTVNILKTRLKPVRFVLDNKKAFLGVYAVFNVAYLAHYLSEPRFDKEKPESK